MSYRFAYRLFVIALAVVALPYCAEAGDGVLVAQAAPEKAAPKNPKPIAPVTGIIDIQRISKESTAAQNVRAQVEERRGKLRDEFAKLENELRTAEQELERQRGVLSADAFDEKRLAYERRVTDAQRKADSSRRKLDDAFQEALRKIQGAMLDVAADVAQKMNLDLVLPRSQVIFWSEQLDITEPVLQGLNAKLPSVKLGEGSADGGAAAQQEGAPEMAPAPAPAPAPRAAPAPKAAPAPAPQPKQ